MPQHDPWLAVVIPNWNGRHLLADCLDSLRHQSCPEFSITVVDNGSTDGSAEWLARAYPEVRCIALPENKGFSAAVNAGIKQTSTPWVLLLNNDMEVEGDCIAALKMAVSQYQQYDFFALKMLNFHQRSHLDGAGDGVIRGGAGYRLGTMEEDGPFYGGDRDVFGACAGAALYRRSLFERVGFLTRTSLPISRTWISIFAPSAVVVAAGMSPAPGCITSAAQRQDRNSIR
jgi:hypothetical protein